MKYGLIGETLKHSFSKEIHNMLGDYEYQLKEIAKDELGAFLDSKDFLGINVTIPYKEEVIPYLDYISSEAKEIGAVNTIVNRNGCLYGYNTDFYGLKSLIEKTGVIVSGKKVAILGTGGTSKTAMAVCKDLGAKEILRVSRTLSQNAITYDDLYKSHNDVDVIINTTPVGTYPNVENSPIDLTKFLNLSGVVDVVYNPLRSKLVSDAKNLSIKSNGGLYMLVAQGVKASEIFIDTEYDKSRLDEVFGQILCQKENVVLTGMPSAGKSTVGKILAQKSGRKFFDTDLLVWDRTGKSPSEIIKTDGEKTFREIETQCIKEVSKLSNVIIATGGGAVLKDENIFSLKQNGKIFFIDRPLNALIPTSDRPLSNTKEEVQKRYNERYDIYVKTADEIIDASVDANMVADQILRSIN